MKEKYLIAQGGGGKVDVDSTVPLVVGYLDWLDGTVYNRTS